jgi:hypothetical protein
MYGRNSSSSEPMNGILYYCAGWRALRALDVSLWSLRRYYEGPIHVFTDGLNTNISKREQWFNVTISTLNCSGVLRYDIPEEQKYKYYHRTAKPHAIRSSPFDKTLFIDVDTLVLTDPSVLFCYPLGFTIVVDDDHHPIRVCSEHKVGEWSRRRLDKLATTGWVNRHMVEVVYDYNLPLINTGVLVVERNHPFLLPWSILSGNGAPLDVDDQYAALMLLPEFRSDIKWLDYRWNAVPGLSGKWTHDDKRIRHYVAQSYLGSGQWKKARKDMIMDLRSTHENFSYNYDLQRRG